MSAKQRFILLYVHITNNGKEYLPFPISMNMNGNGALVVVDGVTLSSQMNNPGDSYGASSNSEGSVDYGNG